MLFRSGGGGETLDVGWGGDKSTRAFLAFVEDEKGYMNVVSGGGNVSWARWEGVVPPPLGLTEMGGGGRL